ncbi:MAG: F0F1 ATP synthase subunit epsilon [Mariprofundus sp.]|nr:F0F1 ATP synthase subunit epsilon [Mariprofundus sp.]
MQILVATAEREVYRGSCTFLVAPGLAGELGIMPKHTPLIAQLCAGELRITKSVDDVDEVFVSGGFVEVQPDMITVLADSAERASDLDEAQAVEAARKAQELIDSKDGEVDLAKAQAGLAITAARLDWLKKKKH